MFKNLINVYNIFTSDSLLINKDYFLAIKKILHKCIQVIWGPKWKSESSWGLQGLPLEWEIFIGDLTPIDIYNTDQRNLTNLSSNLYSSLMSSGFICILYFIINKNFFYCRARLPRQSVISNIAINSEINKGNLAIMKIKYVSITTLNHRRKF